MAELTFREEDHSYWLGERRIFGVTEIIRDNGLMNGTDFFTDEARERGSMVHKACELLAFDNLDWDSVDKQIWGYVYSYKLYLEHTKFRARHVEYQAIHPTLFYAGTFDALGHDFQSDDLLFDLKSGVPEKWHQIQTAFYAELAHANHHNVQRRGTVYLQRDGSIAKFHQHNDKSDWKIAVSALNLTNWRAAL